MKTRILAKIVTMLERHAQWWGILAMLCGVVASAAGLVMLAGVCLLVAVAFFLAWEIEFHDRP